MSTPFTPVRASLALLMMLVLGAATRLPAQEQLLFGPGAEFFGLGLSRLATGELDDRLAAQGYPTFGRTAVGVSLGGYRIFRRRWTLGAEWQGIIQGAEEHQGRTVGFGGGYGTIGVGRVVELSPRVRVTPRVGFGGGGFGLWFDRPEPSVGFDAVLGDPDRYRDSVRGYLSETVLSHGSALVDLGVGVELLARATGRGPMLGLRVGYLAMPSTTEWQLRERPVTGGPEASLAGPYVRVMIGTGRRR